MQCTLRNQWICRFCVHSASESQKSCVEDLASYLPKFGQLLNRTSSKEFWNFRRQIFIFPNLATVQWMSNTIASSDRGEDRHIPEIPCHKDRSKSIPRKQKSSVTRLQILPNGDLVSENTFVFENVWNICPNRKVEMPYFRVLWIFARKGGGQSPARKWPWLISLQTCQISNWYDFLGKALGRFANALQCQRSQQLSANSLGLWKTMSKDSIRNSWVSERTTTAPPVTHVDARILHVQEVDHPMDQECHYGLTTSSKWRTWRFFRQQFNSVQRVNTWRLSIDICDKPPWTQGNSYETGNFAKEMTRKSKTKIQREEWSSWVVARCCHGWRWWSKRDWRAKVPASSGTFQRRSSNCLRVDRFAEKINLSKSPGARTQRNHDFAEELQSPNLRQRKGVCLGVMLSGIFGKNFPLWFLPFCVQTRVVVHSSEWFLLSYCDSQSSDCLLSWCVVLLVARFFVFVPGVIPAYPKCCQTSRLWKGEALECVGCLLRPRCPKPCESRHS